ncbi:MAG: hypothetical protein NC039_07815 [Muribaculaceae bacterium]|nr:hypothetical protein [Muribaculaceae bacterium]
MYKICRIISAILSPLLVPTYAMVMASYLTILRILPSATLWTTTGIIFLITAFLPAVGILILHKTGIVSDTGLNNRTERTIPYVIVLICYLASVIFLHNAKAPDWLPMFFAGAAGATVVNIIVNRWWKISAHSAAMGGMVAMLFRIAAIHQAIVNLNVWISATIIATGILMTARVYMERHTLMQVLAGAANGFLWVWFLSGMKI